MVPNPYDPRLRTDLTANEKAVLHFTGDCLHGDDDSLVDRYIADGYIQHTHGVGQGKEGLRNFMKAVTSRRPGRHIWRPIQVFSSGHFVILHKLLPLWGHDDHFHVRLKCPAGASSCETQTPTVSELSNGGDGCDETLTWWVTTYLDELKNPPKKPSGPKKRGPREYVMADLPKACKGVLASD